MGEAVTVTCLGGWPLCVWEKDRFMKDGWMKRDSKRERDIRPVSQRVMCSGSRGFHDNTGKTIDHMHSFLNPSRLRSVFFPPEVWSEQSLAFTSRLKCTSSSWERLCVLLKTQQVDFAEAVFPLELLVWIQEYSAFVQLVCNLFFINLVIYS